MSHVNAAALEFRHSYVAPPQSHNASLSIVQKAAAYADLLRHEQMERPVSRTLPERPPPTKTGFAHDRSLPTNIPDHPTAIQVNGLRQTATVLPHWSGYVAGVNTYNEGVLCGNWQEARHDPAFEPTGSVIPSANARNWVSTTKLASKWLGDFQSTSQPKLGADNMYETTQMAAAKDVAHPKPRPDFFAKPGFDLEAYRKEYTIGNEVTRARLASTENREQFKPYTNAAQTTGYPKVRARKHGASSAPALARQGGCSSAWSCCAPADPPRSFAPCRTHSLAACRPLRTVRVTRACGTDCVTRTVLSICATRTHLNLCHRNSPRTRHTRHRFVFARFCQPVTV
jgi:hypothetical protein